jgi:hypothetical protein
MLAHSHRRVGLEARKQFVEPIAAFFAQVGELHQVIHMWHYDSMESRKQMRQRAWEIDTWSNTVAKVRPSLALARSLQS